MTKGLSPLLSVVLLIAMTVLISSIIMTWTTTLTKEQTATISNRTKQSIDCTAADITIEDVYLDFAANISRVYIRNSGRTADVIVSAKLLNTRGDGAIYTNTTNLTTANIPIAKGALVTIEFNLTNTLNACVNFSQAIVSTSCSSHAFTGNPKCS